MKKYEINDKEYELIKDNGNCFDYAYDRLRLKGFNDKESKSYNKVNDIKKLDDYIENYCAYGAKYFLLKKIKIEK